jgi:hypothetical protein
MNFDYRAIFDWGAFGVTAAALVELLPAISAALSSIYFIIRIISEVRNRGRRD